jgi:hypothetical protein
MPTRAATYVYAYNKHASAAHRWKGIQDSIKDERELYAAEQKFVSDLAKQVVDLEETYRTRQSNDMIGAKLLSEELSTQRTAFESGKRTQMAREAANVVPDAVLEASGPTAKSIATSKVVSSSSMSKDAVEKTLAYLAKEGVPEAEISDLRRQAQQYDKKRPTYQSGIDPAAMKKYAVAFDVLEAQSDSGYMTVEGRLRAENRTDEQNELLQRYLSALEDGTPALEEFGEGDDGKEKFASAKAIYEKTKAEQSFTRGQRKFFEPAWVDAQRRLTAAEKRADELAKSGAVTSPAAEAARRELLARGIKEEDFAYASLHGTPMLDYVKVADRLYAEGKAQKGGKLTPLNDYQQKIVTLLNQFESSGREWDVKMLEKQLRKQLAPAEVRDAIGFALAYDRQRAEGEGERTPTQAQREEKLTKAATEAADAAAETVARDEAALARETARVAEAEKNRYTTSEAEKKELLTPPALRRPVGKRTLKDQETIEEFSLSGGGVIAPPPEEAEEEIDVSTLSEDELDKLIEEAAKKSKGGK